jgi:indole-3-glycerol phosphate synthase
LLQDLYAGAIRDASAREEVTSKAEIGLLAERRGSALRPRPYLLSNSHIRVIAEVKRASPSKGIIAQIEKPGELALVYESSGAGAVSVLTEGHQFQGSLEDLDAVRDSVSIPVLRKDFIATEYQVLEARAHGADLVLLIVAGLERQELARLKALVEHLGMTALIETHSESEVLIACEIGAELIGINARNLDTFKTDREIFGKLASLIETDAIKIAESAVRNVADVMEYATLGADCVLVGEALVTGDAASLVSSFGAVRKP